MCKTGRNRFFTVAEDLSAVKKRRTMKLLRKLLIAVLIGAVLAG